MLIATFTFPLDPAVLPVPFVPLMADRGITTLLVVTSVGKRLVSKSVFLIALPVSSVNVSIRTGVYPLHHEQGTAKTLNCTRRILTPPKEANVEQKSNVAANIVASGWEHVSPTSRSSFTALAETSEPSRAIAMLHEQDPALDSCVDGVDCSI